MSPTAMSVLATWWCRRRGTGGRLHLLAVLWFHMLGSVSASVALRMCSSVSLSSSTCEVFPSSGRSLYAHGWVAPSTGEEVMFHCTCWPLVETPGAYCCCFAIRSAICSSAISSQGVFLRHQGVELLPPCGKACGTWDVVVSFALWRNHLGGGWGCWRP